ncbi:MAG TPA: amino acid adenylation domain-containing protein, partial [Blastocatellia bacterium]
VQGWSEVGRGERLFDSIVVYENYPVDESLKEMGGEGRLRAKVVKVEEQTNYAVTVAGSAGEMVEVRMSYDRGRIAEEDGKRMGQHLMELLKSMAEAGFVAEMEMMSSAEREQVINWSKGSEVSYDQGKGIHQLIEEVAGRRGEATAIVMGDQELTYKELNRRANQLAHHLRSMGVGPDMLVGICLERSPEMIIGLLGILKARGAYLPLDPDYPLERLAFMLADSETRIVLTQERLAQRLPSSGITAICLDSNWPQIAQENDAKITMRADLDNLAYVIYTSGSTGKPKGVLITHRGVVNVIEASVRIFQVSEDSHVIQLASLSFDASVLEIFSALLGGAALHLVSRDILASGSDLGLFLNKQSITVMATTPSLLDQIPAGGYTALRTISVGGEACGAETAERWSRGRRLLNVYAPTEATIYATMMECAEGLREAPPVGRPIDNVQVYVLDERMRPVPIAVAGELYVGGEGIARGYLKRAALTSERFIPDPFSKREGARLYRTGDVARLRADGNLEFLGRTDYQVKIRAFRIELGEIETALMQQEGVSEVVVVAREEEAGQKRLVAYVVAGREVTGEELRKGLRERLPNYMVPSAFVFLDSLPLTPNGKLDRRALPAPDRTRPELTQVYVPPRTADEELLAKIWSDVLGIEQVGINDNFFELGGHSLLAMQVAFQLHDSFGVEIERPIQSLLEAPTIAGLAERIESARLSSSSPPLPAIEPVESDEPKPASFAQRRLWLFDQLEPGSWFYNMSAALRLKGELNVAMLRQSISEITRRHQSLRTTFLKMDGEPFQVINPVAAMILPVVDLRDLPAPQRGESISRLRSDSALRPFDLSKGPLFRTTLLTVSDDEHILLVNMHHIISDGWSISILLNEVSLLYRSYLSGQSLPLPELPVQYADFSAWQHQWMKGEVLQRQLGYWKQVLSGDLPVLKLPLDRPRPAVQTYEGRAERFKIDLELTNRLRSLSQQSGNTIFAAMLAAFAALLYRYSGQQEIIIGTTTSGRDRAETKSLIGFFVNTLALRIKLSDSYSFREMLDHVRKALLGAYAHQDLPFDKLIEEIQPGRNLNRGSLFQVMFIFQNLPKSSLDLPGLESEVIDTHENAVRSDLDFYLSEELDGLHCALMYNTALFDASTISLMARRFQIMVESIARDPDAYIAGLRVEKEIELPSLQLVKEDEFENIAPMSAEELEKLRG